MLRWIVFVVAVCACAVIAGGAAAWRYHVAAVGDLLDAQTATAQALLASAPAQKNPAGILTAVARPDVTVMLLDRTTGARYHWHEGVTVAIPPPPGGLPSREGPGPPPGFRMPGGRPSFMISIAEFARIAPRRIVTPRYEMTLLPSAVSLAHFLLADLAVCLAALIVLGIAALAIGAVLARAARRPLVRTTLALEALAAGDFAPQTIETGDAPEIARLARAYNAAAATVARSIEERQAAAAEFQRFLADAGHELRTPLTIVGGYVDILAGYVREDDATGRRVIAGLSAETARMRGLVEKMLLLSRLESAVTAPRVVSVGATSEEVAEALRTAYPQRVITVRCDEGARIAIDEDDLYEAERNLVENALRYAPESPVEVSATVRDARVVVAVADRGPGVSAEERNLIFERFYRGRDRADAEGSGLGLAIVARVVERWGGTIELDSNAAETRFVMTFPLAAGSPA